MSNRYDAVVVGARAAGASTAMLLARAGLRVVAVDAGRYGSDTLSTHALMPAGVLQLSRWGVLPTVVAAGTPAIHRMVFRYGERDEVLPVAPFPGVDALYAPRRTVLDPLLVDAARAAGAEIHFATRVTDVLRGADGEVVGVRARGPRGEADYRAPITIGADGARSLVARAVGAEVTAAGTSAAAFVMGYWEGVEADGYQFLYGDRASAGIVPTNDRRVCVWVGMPPARFAALRATPDHGFHAVLAEVAPDWAGRLGAGTRVEPLRGFPGLPGHLRRPWGPGWALVGDAGYFKDPFTAHGLTDALRDAELVARAIADAESPRDRMTGLAAYERTRDAVSHDLFRLGDRVASFAWTPGEVRDLVVAQGVAMVDELVLLSSLDVNAMA